MEDGSLLQGQGGVLSELRTKTEPQTYSMSYMPPRHITDQMGAKIVFIT
jgi:hypothetical protein